MSDTPKIIAAGAKNPNRQLHVQYEYKGVKWQTAFDYWEIEKWIAERAEELHQIRLESIPERQTE